MGDTVKINDSEEVNLFPRWFKPHIPILSVKQPWAGLIVCGKKDIENRSWQTKYRGMIYIHSSLTTDPYYLLGAGKLAEDVPLTLKRCGGIIGTVELVTTVKDSPSEWAIAGRWHWVLKDAKPTPSFFPLKGKLGLFRLTEKVPVTNELQLPF